MAPLLRILLSNDCKALSTRSYNDDNEFDKITNWNYSEHKWVDAIQNHQTNVSSQKNIETIALFHQMIAIEMTR